MEMYNPSHPGRLIREEMGTEITVTALAKHLGVTRAHLSMILNGRASVSPAMSLKLDQAFRKSDGFWLRVQHGYDLAQTRRMRRPKIKPIIPKSELKDAA
jgi:addiction module HigA family antidote